MTATSPAVTRRADPLDLPFFAQLSHADQQLLLSEASIVTFAAGQNLVFRGDVLPGLFIVISGQVFSQVRATEKKALTHSSLYAGDIFGAPGIVGRTEAKQDLKAGTNGAILVVPFHHVRDLMARDPQFSLLIVDQVAGEAERMRDLATELSLQDAQGRLAAWLLKRGESTAGAYQLGCTQAELAAQVGTVREVVSRALARFEREGAILVQGKRVEILDAAKLTQMADFLPEI